MLVKQEMYPNEFNLSFGKRPLEELYLIQDDISQVNNLAHDPRYQSIKDSLANMLLTHLQATGDPRVEGKDPWQDYVYHQYDGFGSVYNKILPKSERDRARLRPSHQPKWTIE